MNPKILGAFVAGVVATAGISYFVMGRQSPPAPTTVQAVSPAPAQTAAASQGAAPVQAPAPEKPAVVAEITPAVDKVPPAPGDKRRWRATPVAPSAAPVQVVSAKAAPAASAPAASQPVLSQPPAQEVPKQEPAPRPVEVVRNEHPQPAPAASAPQPVPAPAPPAEPRKVTLTGGTLLTVRMGEAISTERNQTGDTFRATLDQPIIIDGMVIADRGARVEGRVVESDKGGRVKGVSRLQLELTRLSTSDGQMVEVHTANVEREGASSNKSDAAKVGGGAAVGAVLGAIFGGGKGAAIGAAGGGAAGGGVVLATRGKPIEIPAETRLTFRLDQPVTITEQLNSK